jgi:pyruvate-formate lyase-activating enzyme
LKWEDNIPYRIIKSISLSRPEDYLSIYQSGCNFSCLKCHSREFSQYSFISSRVWFSKKYVAFTGGDLACNPEWYCLVAEKI